jgi:hypothetical protein
MFRLKSKPSSGVIEYRTLNVRYMTNRRNTYPISTEYKHKETQIIKAILHNNGYTPQILPSKKRKTMNTTPDAT